MPARNKREFLMLAHKFVESKHHVCGWLYSEKLDGIRAWWDGGITRGLAASSVPWANVTKHGRFVTPPVATGLWTRYGQPIQAPDWWLDQLPKSVPLDGELWAGPKNWQTVSSITRTQDPTKVDWDRIKYAAFDLPRYNEILYDSTINITNFKKTFKGCLEWIENLLERDVKNEEQQPFYARYHDLKELIGGTNSHIWVHPHGHLPSNTPSCKNRIAELLEEIEKLQGEGLMLRNPIGFYRPERSYDLLKVKSLDDMEGEVIGYKWGKPTDLERSLTGIAQDKMIGLMGSLTLRLESGVIFDLASGFDMSERAMQSTSIGIPSDAAEERALSEGAKNPGGVVSTNDFENPLFKVGDKVTFQYRELSDSGVPKEARYMRVREE